MWDSDNIGAASSDLIEIYGNSRGLPCLLKENSLLNQNILLSPWNTLLSPWFPCRVSKQHLSKLKEKESQNFGANLLWKWWTIPKNPKTIFEPKLPSACFSFEGLSIVLGSQSSILFNRLPGNHPGWTTWTFLPLRRESGQFSRNERNFVQN